MVINDLHVDAIPGLFAEDVGNARADFIILKNVVLEQDRRPGVGEVDKERAELVGPIGEDRHLVMNGDRGMGEGEGEFYELLMMLGESNVVERADFPVFIL